MSVVEQAKAAAAATTPPANEPVEPVAAVHDNPVETDDSSSVFAELAEEFLAEEGVAADPVAAISGEEPTAPAPAPTVPNAENAEPAAAPAAEATAPVTPTEPSATAVQPPAAPTPPLAEAPVPPQPQGGITPDELKILAEQKAEWRKQAIEVLTDTHYSFTEDDMREYEEDPVKKTSQLMARTYLDAVQGSLSAMLAHLPNLVDRVIQVKQADREAEESFFGAYPELKAYKDDVARLAYMHRQANPTMTKDQMMQDVAVQVAVLRKVHLQGMQTQTQPAPAAVTPPATPAPRQPPVRSAPPQSGNQFERLAEEFLSE